MNDNNKSDYNKINNKYKKIIEYYFEGCDIDIDKLLDQPEKDLRLFINTEVKSNWKNCRSTLKLHKELSDKQFVKPLSYKKYMKELMREKRTIEEIKEEYIKKLEKENPSIKAKKIDII